MKNKKLVDYLKRLGARYGGLQQQEIDELLDGLEVYYLHPEYMRGLTDVFIERIRRLSNIT
jgi:hypothetical protein